jgi:hypothetical protein
MPSDLKQKVKIAINNFVASRTSNDHGDIAIDVLRVVRDEAALLMERQTIVDAFDSDALKFYDGDESLKIQVERIKVCMNAYLIFLNLQGHGLFFEWLSPFMLFS